MIDVAAFTGPWPWRPVGMDAARLAAHLGAHGVDRALVSPLEGLFWEDPQLANERLGAEISGLPLVLAPFLDPTFPSWRRDMEACLNVFRSRAFRVAPGYRGFGPEHPAFRELLEKAAREKVTVILQMRMLDARGHNPRAVVRDVPLDACLDAAASCPEARILLGAARLGELRGRADRLRALGNVHVETSAVETIDGLRALIGLLGPGRILFGSHSPLFITRSALLKAREARLEAAEERAILRENAARLLGD